MAYVCGGSPCARSNIFVLCMCCKSPCPTVTRPRWFSLSTSRPLWTMSPKQQRLSLLASSSSAFLMAVVTPKQNPDPSSISISIVLFLSLDSHTCLKKRVTSIISMRNLSYFSIFSLAFSSSHAFCSGMVMLELSSTIASSACRSGAVSLCESI